MDGRLIITEPKTARSLRTVPLSPAVVAMLRRHKTARNAERLRCVNQWTDSGLVFTTELENPVGSRNLLRVVEVAVKAAGVEGCRRAYASTLRRSRLARSWGVHIKAVADLLGHSSITITGDMYGHTRDDTARAAVGVWSGALGL